MLVGPAATLQDHGTVYGLSRQTRGHDLKAKPGIVRPVYLAC